MSEALEIGFSQRIRLDWLDRTARLWQAGAARPNVQAALADLLQEQMSVGGSARRGNREKAITILLRTWVAVSPELAPFRDAGAGFLDHLQGEERLPVHWGMSMAAYPFLWRVAEATGRLVRLQGRCAAADVQRRLREQLGERETVARAARRVLRGWIDWGVLIDTDVKGTYAPGKPQQIRCPALAAWVLEAGLRASGAQRAPLAALAGSPALFPFILPPVTGLDFAGGRVEVCRQAGDDVLELRAEL